MSPKTKSRNKGLAKLARDTRIRSSATDEFIQRYLQSIDCPRALTVALLSTWRTPSIGRVGCRTGGLQFSGRLPQRLPSY